MMTKVADPHSSPTVHTGSGRQPSAAISPTNGDRKGSSFLQGAKGRSIVIGIPYLWLLILFLTPLLLVAAISISFPEIAQPPFRWPSIDWENYDVLANFANYARLWNNPRYFSALVNSVETAGISTAFCLLLGYPIAYYIARSHPARRNALLMLIILPFWTSFLIRVYAWIGLLQDTGLINNMLLSIGIIDAPVRMLNTDFAVYLGIAYSYLPFMILPLFANLEKLDPSLLEAAADLGARPFRAFLRVTLPLSLSGIVAGSLLVFIPAVGEFVIPELLGGPESQMIGRLLWDEFFRRNNWPAAAALAVAILLVLVLPIMLFQHVLSKQSEERA